MKKVYFVRHGETNLNKEKREQGPDAPLSDLGRKQAEFVAKRFDKIKVDKIISSSYARAKETTEIINKHLNKEVTYSDDLVERRPPSKYIGVSYTDPEYLEAKKTAREKRLIDPSWRLSDEENFIDLKDRANRVLSLLQNTEEDSLLVVTHGGFLAVIISTIIFGDELTYREYMKIFRALTMNNTGITLAEHGNETDEHDPRWKLIIWNDHSHLG